MRTDTDRDSSDFGQNQAEPLNGALINSISREFVFSDRIYRIEDQLNKTKSCWSRPKAAVPKAVKFKAAPSDKAS